MASTQIDDEINDALAKIRLHPPVLLKVKLLFFSTMYHVAQ